MKKLICLTVIFVVLCLSGCSKGTVSEEEKVPQDFTVVDRNSIPDEILAMVEKRQEEEFQMSCLVNGYLYIAVGYGKKDTGGYSIMVDEIYEKGQDIHIKTTLIGPAPGEAVNQLPTCPYIVIKLMASDKNILFD